jgi:hypothetical protein
MPMESSKSNNKITIATNFFSGTLNETFTLVKETGMQKEMFFREKTR